MLLELLVLDEAGRGEDEEDGDGETEEEVGDRGDVE